MKKFKITNTCGEIYVGDLCYALDDEVYDVFANSCKEGTYTVPDPIDEGETLQFAIVNTPTGDGLYDSVSGAMYPVDSGTIGICDSRLCVKPDCEFYGTIMKACDAEIYIDDDGDITIETETEYETIYTGDGDSYEKE